MFVFLSFGLDFRVFDVIYIRSIDPRYPPFTMSSPSERKSFDITPESIDTEKSLDVPQYKQDAFGDEEFAEVKYKVLKWW